MGSEHEPVVGEAEEAEGTIKPAEEVEVVHIEDVETVPEPKSPDSDVTEVAQEVIAGKWGVGQDRRNRLSEAGHDVRAVEEEVVRLRND